MPVPSVCKKYPLVPPVIFILAVAIVALPDTLNVPLTFAPVPVTTNMFALPALLILTFPFELGIFTLLFPLEYEPIKLPPVMLPVTFNVVNVPSEVMLG